VSHDRYLIEACADQLWVVADHAVTSFDGDLDDYRRLVLSARSRQDATRESYERVTGRDRNERPKGERQKPLKQKISEAEAEIERITAIIEKIDTALALPDIFTRDPRQAAQLGQARANAASALQRAEEDWLQASTQSETAG
jgi:ATP-binding cassette, subfamily F, member 3